MLPAHMLPSLRTMLPFVVAAVCASLVRRADAGPALMWLQSLATVDPLAVCNDGVRCVLARL